MFFKKVKIRFTDGTCVKRFYLFGIAVLDVTKKKNEELHIRTPKSCKPKSKDQPIFYLKVNRIHQTSYDCLQHWMDIANKMGAFCYIICDKKEFEYGMFSKPCFFYRNSFQIISSDRRSLKKPIKKLLAGVDRSKLWQRIALSMTTPFVHAKKNNFSRTYNIDADDIMILARPEKIAKALLQMEKIAELKNVDAMNLDMFVSKSFNVHWSFGVVFVRHPGNCISALRNNINWRKDVENQKKYKTSYVEEFNFNVDWLFTFLRDTKKLNLQTFCIKNAVVVHMPDIAISRHWAFVFQWRNDRLYFPIISEVYRDKKWAYIPIPESINKIDAEIENHEYSLFMQTFYWTDYWFENSMLNIAKNRGLINSFIYDNYKSIPRKRWE